MLRSLTESPEGRTLTMLLVIWVLRLELSLQEICTLALAYMFGATVYLLNNGYARQYALDCVNKACIDSLVHGGV